MLRSPGRRRRDSSRSPDWSRRNDSTLRCRGHDEHHDEHRGGGRHRRASDRRSYKYPKSSSRSPRPRRSGDDSCSRPPPLRRWFPREEVDEFGRVRLPVRGRSTSPRSRSISLERRRLKRQEERRDRKQRNCEKSGSGIVASRDEQEYKKLLWPPGTDLSSYSFDEILYWYVTPDKVWWYRPDLTLWYDCRSASYYSYDAESSDYVSIAAEVATQALLTGISVAPQKQKVVASAVTTFATEADAATAEVAENATRSAREQVSLTAMAESEPSTAASPQAAIGEDRLDAEDKVAMGLHSHTESWQGKKDSQEDRYIEGLRMGKLGTAYGVFDGHGGVLAAEFVMKHLPKNIARCYEQQRAPAKRGGVDPRRMLNTMEEAFPQTDRELLQLARRKGFADGTTALILLISGKPHSPHPNQNPPHAPRSFFTSLSLCPPLAFPHGFPHGPQIFFLTTRHMALPHGPASRPS